ncbi:DUF2569 domain-containing protein [Mesorhizobium sp. AR07]|uniref:DUF2569 domain-containing protein n=1 Tax=Mesorhizobium sp. AR07 TaxID=2865838 RepID=UPI00215EA4A5|nr:DUF2569 domain-containing protein [Mesorhizobium sp. AR07]UVK47310.1 DUF2569 domain-containing protein [Mesorhizobium sp. AR07]
MSEIQPSAPSSRQGPEGIGGYLIVPMLGLIFMPLAGLIVFNHHIGLSEYFNLLTCAQKVFVVAEIFGYLAIAVACPIGLLFLLFGKKRAFPRLYLVWAAVNPVSVLVDLAAAKILLGDILEAQGVALFDGETAKSIQWSIEYFVIWILYMHKSQRVQNTFTQ